MRQPRILPVSLSLLFLTATVFSCAKPAVSTPSGNPGAGTVIVSATLDGSPWSGPVSFTVTGLKTIPGSSVPQSFQTPAGSWTIAHLSGAPSGAMLTIVTPYTPQTLAAGGTIAFNLHFTTQAGLDSPTPGTININATLDGSPWQAPVADILYVRIGSTWYQTGLGGASPQSFSNMPPLLDYRVAFIYSGPLGALYDGVSPSKATLTPGGTINLSLNFSSAGCRAGG